MLLELKGLLVDKSLEKLGIEVDDNEIEVRMAFKSSAIECVREILNEHGNVVQNEVMLYITGSGSFIVKHSYDEIKKMINDSKAI